MGPRAGSPAAETQLKNKTSCPAGRDSGRRVRRFLISMGAGFLAASQGLFPATCWGRSAEVSHSVSVVVIEPMLSLSDDTEDFSLSLGRDAAGASGNAQVVNYQIYGNVIPTAPVKGIISGKLSGGQEGIEIQADVGSFANQGTPGHAQLQEHLIGFQTIGDELVPLADKGASSGNQGGILNGTIPIAWKATTTDDLPAGTYPVFLTVTLKES